MYTAKDVEEAEVSGIVILKALKYTHKNPKDRRKSMLTFINKMRK